MTLYSASLKDIAQPVEKKIKEKKPVTEKQLAALSKAQETRKRKREEADEVQKQVEIEVENKKKEIELKEAELAEKKRVMSEKRKIRKLEKLQNKNIDVVKDVLKTEVKEDTDTVDAAKVAYEKVEKKRLAYEKRVANKKKKASKPTDLDEALDEAMGEIKSEPPVWFRQFVDGVKNEEVKVVPKNAKKDFKKETVETASSSWNDGLTRDCIQNEVDNHLSKMYNMIFAGRRMK
jgi:hypothetical protein